MGASLFKLNKKGKIQKHKEQKRDKGIIFFLYECLCVRVREREIHRYRESVFQYLCVDMS